MLKLKRAGRLGTRGVGVCGLLFQGEGVCLKVGNSREVRDENGNSRGGLLDRRATFISYNWPKQCAFPPFFCSVPRPLYPQTRPGCLVVKKEGEGKEL